MIHIHLVGECKSYIGVSIINLYYLKHKKVVFVKWEQMAVRFFKCTDVLNF